MGRDRILTTTAVERLLYEGRQIVIMDGNVLQLDAWLDDHPGGRLAILHMIGRDATNEINIYHSSSTLRSMRRYRIGRLVEPWMNKTPPIRGGVYHNPTASLDDVDCDIELSDASTSSLSVKSVSSGTDENPSSKCSARFKSNKNDLESRLSSNDIARKKYVPPPRDEATDELIRSIMQGEIDKSIHDYPSLDPRIQRDIELKFRDLHERVKEGGFYQCHYVKYLQEVVRYVALFALFAFALVNHWYLSSAAVLGLFWHQIMFTAHDAGHRGITHNFTFDTSIGIFIADFCCGLSIGWWKSSHNVHHLITNHPEHDPDIQNVPLFATCPSFFKSVHSTYYDFTFAWDKVADLTVRYQKYTYYPVMALARFNLYILSIHHLLLGPKPSRSTAWIRNAEITGIACYWFLFGYCLVWRTLPDWPTRIAFVLVSHIVTFPLHVQITLSHWGMPTSDLGEAESFPQRQLRTTMDVDCPAWLDFIHGGLQFQAVHHLFPRVPRHNLRKLQVLVREFCEETGIKYSILGFVDGNKEVVGRLQEVTAQVELMLKCQQHMAETGESGLH